MLNDFTMRAKPLLKIMKVDIVYYFFRNRIFINKVAVTVEKDLSALVPLSGSPVEHGPRLVEITPESLQEGNAHRALLYPVSSKAENRHAKAIAYLNRGYRGFALARGRHVCGDIWYVSRSGLRDDGKEALHPDLEWLHIQCGHNEVYAFDMHVYPEQRGKNLAVLLQNGALHEMKKKGFTKAFGYYWADYIPALWVHRTLRWKEVSRIKVSRVFFIRQYIYQSNPPVKMPSV